MAAPNKVHLTVDDTGIVQFKRQNTETATKASELLQENHDVHSLVSSPDVGLHVTRNTIYSTAEKDSIITSLTISSLSMVLGHQLR